LALCNELQVGDDDPLVGLDQLPVTKRERIDTILKMDERHTLVRNLESENSVRKEAADDSLSDLLAYSEKLFPVNGQGRSPKISPDRPILDASSGISAGRDGLLAILDALGGISAGTDDLPVDNAQVVLSRNGHSLQCSPQVTETEQIDKMLKTDENHRLTRKLEAENPVQREAGEENVSDLLACSEKLFPVSGERRPSKILPDGTICDASGGIVTGRDGLPVTKDEVVLSPSGGFLLCSAGYLVLRHELQVGNDGRLLGPDDLPVTEVEQTDKILKTDDLLLNCKGFPVISKDGLLVLKISIMQVGGLSIPLDDLTIESDETFHGPDGALILGDDGLVLTKGDVLMRHDEKPLLTLEGKPILQYDMFSSSNSNCRDS